jgi:thiol-disulfide isomerase/thioredoxin
MRRRARSGSRSANHPTIGARAPVVAWAVLAAVLPACEGPARAPRSGASAGRTEAAVNVEFADLDRIHAVLGGFRHRPVFVNFWATWCVPCVEELPDLATLSREEASNGIGFIGISLDAWVTGNGSETEHKVKRALAGAGVDYTNLIYKGDQDPLLEGFQLPGPIPYSVLLDGSGKRAAAWEGKATIGEVRRAIAEASRRGGAPAPAPPDGRTGNR